MIKNMIKAAKGAHGAGYRAGRSSIHYSENPYNGRFSKLPLAYFWNNGWHEGCGEIIEKWLAQRMD